MGACAVEAQTYSNLYSFSLYTPSNPDGALPQGSLVIANGILYGTTDEGGSNGVGRCSPSTPTAPAWQAFCIRLARSTPAREGPTPTAPIRTGT
ncbi:MAG: hypothetical protein KGR98_11515 [Verrucomicrobia bacterium]|nr:hypothetical protein [Verrucomicrobiota bacterium]